MKNNKTLCMEPRLCALSAVMESGKAIPGAGKESTLGHLDVEARPECKPLNCGGG